MKKIVVRARFASVTLVLALLGTASANTTQVKIDDLPPAPALTGTEGIPCTKSGVTYRCAVSSIFGLVLDGSIPFADGGSWGKAGVNNVSGLNAFNTFLFGTNPSCAVSSISNDPREVSGCFAIRDAGEITQYLTAQPIVTSSIVMAAPPDAGTESVTFSATTAQGAFSTSEVTKVNAALTRCAASPTPPTYCIFAVTNDAPYKYAGPITAINSTTLTVSAWYLVDGTNSRTTGTPVGTTVTINPTATVWGSDIILKFTSDSYATIGIGQELDVLSAKSSAIMYGYTANMQTTSHYDGNTAFSALGSTAESGTALWTYGFGASGISKFAFHAAHKTASPDSDIYDPTVGFNCTAWKDCFAVTNLATSYFKVRGYDPTVGLRGQVTFADGSTWGNVTGSTGIIAPAGGLSIHQRAADEAVVIGAASHLSGGASVSSRSDGYSTYNPLEFIATQFEFSNNGAFVPVANGTTATTIIGQPAAYIINGGAAAAVGIDRNASAGGAVFMIVGGGAKSGGTNLAGGDLRLYSGVSTGSGTSNVVIYAYPGVAGPAADNTPTAVATFSAGGLKLPTLSTGTPVASLCLDASGNIIKKTTTGACI